MKTLQSVTPAREDYSNQGTDDLACAEGSEREMSYGLDKRVCLKLSKFAHINLYLLRDHF